MKKIKFGVMGCASIARRSVIHAMLEIDEIELVAVASRTAEKALSYAKEFNCIGIKGYQELLNLKEIEAIYMPLPTGLHFEWAHKALDAGKHLFIEKSLATNLDEAKSIIDKAKKLGLLVKENYMFEYHSQQSAVQDLIQEQVGIVRLFRANFGFPPLSAENFRYIPELGGGALLDAGGYVLKGLSVFFPNHVPVVKASTLTTGINNVDISGAIMVDLVGENEVIPAHLAFGFDHHYQCNIEIWGNKGKLTTDRTFTSGANFSPSVYIEKNSGNKKITLAADNHFKNILSVFVRKLVSNNDFDSEYDAILTQAKLQDTVRQLTNGTSIK